MGVIRISISALVEFRSTKVHRHGWTPKGRAFLGGSFELCIAGQKLNPEPATKDVASDLRTQMSAE